MLQLVFNLNPMAMPSSAHFFLEGLMTRSWTWVCNFLGSALPNGCQTQIRILQTLFAIGPLKAMSGAHILFINSLCYSCLQVKVPVPKSLSPNSRQHLQRKHFTLRVPMAYRPHHPPPSDAKAIWGWGTLSSPHLAAIATKRLEKKAAL